MWSHIATEGIGELVMLTQAIGREGKANPRDWLSAKATRLVALLGALILTSITVNTLTILASSNLG